MSAAGPHRSLLRALPLLLLALPAAAAEVIVHDFDGGSTLGWTVVGADRLTTGSPGPSGRPDDLHLGFGDVASTRHDDSLRLVAPAQITGGLHGVAATCGALELDLRVLADNGEPVSFQVALEGPPVGFGAEALPEVAASFRLSGEVGRDDGWVHVVVPLALGSPPAGWRMRGSASPAQWNALLVGADRLSLPLDAPGGTAERYGIDNVRLVTGECAMLPESCLAPPSLAAWWPLDEPAGSGATADRAGLAAGRRVGARGAVPGVAGGAFRFDGDGWVEGEDAPLLDFAAGQDFSIGLWVRTESDSELDVLLEKRDFSLAEHEHVIGWQLFLLNGRPGFQLSNGVEHYNFLAPFTIADGTWHLLAVTVDRDSRTGIQWYLDGRPVGRGESPIRFGGDLSNRHGVRIGAGSAPGSNDPTFHFSGELDEIVVFRRALGPEEVERLYAAGSAGLCDDSLTVPSHTSIACDEVTIELCHRGSGVATYDLEIGPLPQGALAHPGLTCPVDGPAEPSLLRANPASLRVPPGACLTAEVAMELAAGAARASGCYQVTATPRSGGRGLRQVGSLTVPSGVCCGRKEAGVLAVSAFEAETLVFECRNPTPEPIVLRYQVEVSDAGRSRETGVRLDGGEPGSPVTGELALGPDQTAAVAVAVELTDFEAFHPVTVLLRALDPAGPGEVLSSQTVRSVPGGRATPRTARR